MSESLMRALAHEALQDHTLEVVRVAKPAAGAQWAFTFPGDRIWRVRGVTALLTTSAVVANRIPALSLDDGANFLAVAGHVAATAAGSATEYGWNTFAPLMTAPSGGFASAGLPDLTFAGGLTLRSQCGGFDVGDQWSAVVIWAETLLHQPTGVNEFQRWLELTQRIMTSPTLEELGS